MAGEATGARVAQLDRLRGIAILGIFFMNVPFMGGSEEAIMAGRPDLLGWAPIDRIAYLFQVVVMEGTARGMLQMLFGAGMVILTTRLMATMTAGAAFRAYYRRYVVLFLFGVVHIFAFLWVGDILSIYGPAALLLYLFRKCTARTMLVWGLMIGPVFFFGGQALGEHFAPDRPALLAAAEAGQRAGRPLTEAQREAVDAERAERADEARLPAEMARERAARLGPFPAYSGWLHAETIAFLGEGYHPFMVLEALATMLIGAALFKWGVLQGERSRAAHGALVIAGYAIGIGLRVPIALMDMELVAPVEWLVYTEEIGRLAMTIGHVSVIALLSRSRSGERVLAPFGEAGRIALSLYFLQTLVGMWLLFPGFGLGLWGSLGWAGLTGVAIAMVPVQLAIAHLYLRRYRTGPVEWLWRRLAGADRAARAPDGAGPPIAA